MLEEAALILPTETLRSVVGVEWLVCNKEIILLVLAVCLDQDWLGSSAGRLGLVMPSLHDEP